MVAATVAKSIAPEIVPGKPGVTRYGPRHSATAVVRKGDAATPRDKAATGPAAKK